MTAIAPCSCISLAKLYTYVATIRFFFFAAFCFYSILLGPRPNTSESKLVALNTPILFPKVNSQPYTPPIGSGKGD